MYIETILSQIPEDITMAQAVVVASITLSLTWLAVTIAKLLALK